MGAIVASFDGSQPVLVPRSRFLPVKTTNDLLTLRSDAYELTPQGRLELVVPAAPVVDLDKQYFQFVADFDERFPTVPSLKETRTFTVRGDWHFTAGVAFSGDVELSGSGALRAVENRA